MTLGVPIMTFISRLCSDLLMRLSYYIHPAYYNSKNLKHCRELNQGLLGLELSTISARPEQLPNQASLFRDEMRCLNNQFFQAVNIFFFTSDHQTFYSLFYGRTCQGCINHDIAVGLSSELLLRLACCIHRIYEL